MADPLSAAASIVALLQLTETVLTSCYRFVGHVNNAAAEVDRTIREAGQLMVALLDLESLVKTDGNSESSRLNALAGENGPLMVCIQSLKELDSKLSTAAGPMSFRRKLRWPFESKKVDEVLDRIQSQIPILQLALTGENFDLTRNIKDSIESSKLREEREKVLNWLACTDSTVKHLASRQLHEPGSNHWIFELDAFKEWKETPRQTAWLHGIPGAGKTIICSTIIDHVDEFCKTQPESRLAFYYFDFNDQSIQKLGHVLRSLILQLSRYSDQLPSHVRLLYETCDRGRKEPDDELLASTFFELLNDGQRSFVIIDALDECPLQGREQFHKVMMQRIGDRLGQYNFLFTSRKELDIELSVTEIGERMKLHNVPILTGDVDTDVRLHVHRSIAGNRTLRDWSDELRKEIEEKIVSGAHGMFRWAVCQLELIKNCRQAGAVRKTLKNLPTTLDATYDRILSSIPDQTWQIARSALMLLTYSLRPLTLQELAEAMVIDVEDQKFDSEEHRLTSYRYVLEICSSLVSVSSVKHNRAEKNWLTEKTGIERTYFKEKDVEVIQFAHFSVKEYMMLERAKTESRVSRFCFSKTVANRSIAELSVIYLLDFSRGARLNDIDFESFPFLAYAARFWWEHWRFQLSSKEQESVNTLIQRLLDSSEPSSYINYLNICNPDMLIDQQFPSTFAFSRRGKCLDAFPQPLYYTAQLGHHELCEWLLESGKSNVNSTKGTFGQPIQIASRFGHDKVVKLLLDHGAEVNTLCGEYGYPLQAAAYGGHADVLRILLDHGADVNAQGGRFGSALIAACHQGHLAAAKILIEKGADMDIICTHKGKALNIAASKGNTPLVRLLLQKGADVNDTCGGEGSALYAAAESGALDTIKMLIVAGADINLKGGYKCTALQAACSKDRSEGDSNGHIDVVKFLLEKGADVNIRGGNYGDALQACVEAGNVSSSLDILNLLLDYGAEINHRGGIYHSAIRAAVYCGNVEAAHVLIDRGVEVDDEIFFFAVENQRETVIPVLFRKGVNVNAENKDGTVLQMAIKNDDMDTTMALLADPLIDISAQGGEYGKTALYWAVGRDNEKVVKLLLDRGADVNAPCGDGSYCLTEATGGGKREMVHLLLERGADVNAQSIGKHHHTALVAACDRQYEDLVRLFLSRGADVNAWDDEYGDALQCAAYKADEGLVKLLLDHGANVKALEGNHGSCLECAIMAKDPKLTRLLLDAGANINFSRPIKDLEEGNLGFGGPLSGAIWYKQEGLFSLLIDRGSDVNAPGRRHYGSALEEAVSRDDEEAFHILLERGANVNQIAGHHGCALAYAIVESRENKKGRADFVQLLLDAGADVNLQCGYYGCPLAAAADKGNLPLVEKLLDSGADIDAPAGDHGSAFQIAIARGDLELFRLLLNRGADVNSQGVYHRSPLGAACRYDTMLKELLEHGADPALGNSHALAMAARRGKDEVVSLLLGHGANLHSQDGVTGKALHEAASGGHISTCKLLLDRGADINAFGGYHGNALMTILGDRSASRSNLVTPMTEFLLERGAKVNSPASERHTSALQAAISNHNFQFVDRLLDAGADVNAHDPHFGTALSSAASSGKIDVLEKLLRQGAHLNLGGEKLGAPLQAASRRVHLKAMELLLSHGADINQLSGKTGYALHAACRVDDGEEAVKLLIARGADVNIRGGKYETALQAAATHGRLVNLRLLLENGADPRIEGGRYGSALKAAVEKKHYHVANFLRRYMEEKEARAQAQA